MIESTAVPCEFVMSLLEDEIRVSLFYDGGTIGGYRLLMPQKNVTDDTTKVLIFDEKELPRAVLICSYIKFGDLPCRSVYKSSEAKLKLSGNASDVVLSPLAYGEKEGVSFALWKYYSPFSSNKALRYIQKKKLQSNVFAWLLDATKQSKVKLIQTELCDVVVKPLELLQDMRGVNSKIKREVVKQLTSISKDQWEPFFCIEHNDFWLGNVLINKNNSYGISVIDWAGSNSKGMAIYDLVRMSLSLKVSDRFFVNQLRLTCQVMNCDLNSSKGYLLSSFANLAENLGDFPEERFIGLLDKSCDYLFDNVN